MKYLWIEDFDGNASKEELEPKWKKFCGISDRYTIISSNLKESLEFITSNPDGFDTVILDINFPITSPRDSDNDLYKEYLENVITKDFYEKNKDSGAGLILYFYLILKLRFPKERIAFLSANIDSNIPEDINNALKYLGYYGKKNENLDYYDGLVKNLQNKYNEVIEWKYSDEINNLDEYRKSIKEKSLKLNELEINYDINKASVKYDKAKKEFEKVGIKLSQAFTKPDRDDNEANQDCLVWKNNLESNYCRFRRCVIEMCNILLNEIDEDKILFNKKYKKDKNLSKLNLEEMLKNMSTLPLILTEDQEASLYYSVLSQITHYWESSKRPNFVFEQNEIKKTYGELHYFAYHSVLKTLRNWIAHNKLNKETDVYFASFIFGIGMRGLFDTDKIDNKEYLIWEKKLLTLIGEGKSKDNSNPKEEVIIDVIKKSCSNLYDIASNSKYFAYTPNMSSIIHDIGSEKSKIDCKKEYILRLYGHCLFPIQLKPTEYEKNYGFNLVVITDYLNKVDSREFEYFKAIYNLAF